MKSFFIMYLILDESGDLGWKFDLPNRAGGSSRFFTLGHFCCQKNQNHLIQRFIKDINIKFNLNPNIEKKGCSFDDKDALKICQAFNKFLINHPDLRFGAITINKFKVADNLRIDCNILYNYGTYRLLNGLIHPFQKLHLVHDKRSIKVVKSKFIVDYLHTQLRTMHESSIIIDYDPKTSSHFKDLWLADWIVNFVWRHYEDGRSQAYNELRQSKQFFETHLYF